MPGMDGTGPWGDGRLGRGLGPCGRGLARGRGGWSGRGFGPGMGWGRGAGWGAAWQGRGYVPAGDAPFADVDDETWLKGQARMLKRQLAAVERELGRFQEEPTDQG